MSNATLLEAANGTISGFVDSLRQQRFYGSLELKFEAGRIVLLRKTETFKSENELRGTRNSDGRTD